MIFPLTVALAATLTTARPVASVCPADDPKSRAMVTRFLTRPSWQADRDSIGFWTPVYPAQVRLLTDATDAIACQRIAGIVGASGSRPGWAWTAYEVNNLYFVANRSVEVNGEFRLGFSPMYIFDGNFQFVRGAAL
jgi:hypothetical protein